MIRFALAFLALLAVASLAAACPLTAAVTYAVPQVVVAPAALAQTAQAYAPAAVQVQAVQAVPQVVVTPSVVVPNALVYASMGVVRVRGFGSLAVGNGVNAPVVVVNQGGFLGLANRFGIRGGRGIVRVRVR